MLKEILLPDLGEGIEAADVSEILVNSGDSVSVDDIILVLESDKASMEIPAENDGVVKEVLVKAGDEVKTGSPLISLEVSSGSVAKPETDKKDDAPVEKIETPPTVVEEKNNIVVEEMPSDKTFASPGVRRLARELEIELSGVKATGLKGRITKEDLHGYIKQKMSQGGSVNVPPQPKIDFSKSNVREVCSSMPIVMASSPLINFLYLFFPIKQ